MAVFTAWQTARLSTFHKGKLPPMPTLLRELKVGTPKRAQTSEEKIAALRAIRATMGSSASAKPRLA